MNNDRILSKLFCVSNIR